VAASRATPDNTDPHIEKDPVAGAVPTPQDTRKEIQKISVRICATTVGARDTWLDNVTSSREATVYRQSPPPTAADTAVKLNTVTQKTAVPETYIEVEICNQIHKCLLDTRCDHSIIPWKLVPTATLEPAPVDVKAANGSIISKLGK